MRKRWGDSEDQRWSLKLAAQSACRKQARWASWAAIGKGFGMVLAGARIGIGAVVCAVAVSALSAFPLAAQMPARPTVAEKSPNFGAALGTRPASLAGIGYDLPDASSAVLTSARPLARPWEGRRLPKLRWDARAGSQAWSLALLMEIERHPRTFLRKVPQDIKAFCPGFAEGSAVDRAAFWAALLSGIARHESRSNPRASGAGGRYLGLMQISPATARNYGCAASGEGLLDGGPNMVCSVKIVAHHVARDGQVVGQSGAWRGAARDWMVLRDPAAREDITGWIKKQEYCQ